MRTSWRRPARPLTLSLAAAVIAGLTVAGPAQAFEVTSGSLTFSGDPSDYITGGQTYDLSTADGAVLHVSSINPGVVEISAGEAGEAWQLTLAAPPGEALTEGTYTEAMRYPFAVTGPSLSLSGAGRGCNELSGTFTITDIEIAAGGYVQTLDATFEQHCERGESAARGEVHIANGPAPVRQSVDPLTVAAAGAAVGVNGNAVVSGTVSCTKPADVSVTGTVTQVVKRTIVRGSFALSVPCIPGAPVAWTGAAVPAGTTPFRRGDVEVQAQAFAFDQVYNEPATDTATGVVTLRKR